jgi:hypothetical protein
VQSRSLPFYSSNGGNNGLYGCVAKRALANSIGITTNEDIWKSNLYGNSMIMVDSSITINKKNGDFIYLTFRENNVYVRCCAVKLSEDKADLVLLGQKIDETVKKY